LKVIYITANIKYDNYEKFYATIPEWLYLIDNSEYVIANSFHGIVFSLLFENRYGVIPLTGNYAGMNERFYSLFEYLNISPQFMHNNFDNILINNSQKYIKVDNLLKSHL
jgi:hypothetical protein